MISCRNVAAASECQTISAGDLDLDAYIHIDDRFNQYRNVYRRSMYEFEDSREVIIVRDPNQLRGSIFENADEYHGLQNFRKQLQGKEQRLNGSDGGSDKGSTKKISRTSRKKKQQQSKRKVTRDTEIEGKDTVVSTDSHEDDKKIIVSENEYSKSDRKKRTVSFSEATWHENGKKTSGGKKKRTDSEYTSRPGDSKKRGSRGGKKSTISIAEDTSVVGEKHGVTTWLAKMKSSRTKSEISAGSVTGDEILDSKSVVSGTTSTQRRVKKRKPGGTGSKGPGSIISVASKKRSGTSEQYPDDAYSDAYNEEYGDEYEYEDYTEYEGEDGYDHEADYGNGDYDEQYYSHEYSDDDDDNHEHYDPFEDDTRTEGVD